MLATTYMMKGSNSSEREARKIKVQLTHIIQHGEQLKRKADAALEKEKRAKKANPLCYDIFLHTNMACTHVN